MNTGTEKLLPGQGNLRKIWACRVFYAMMAVGVAYFVVFKYATLYGLLIAFKDYRIRLGIMGSPWVGFSNFPKALGNRELPRYIYNTLLISFGRLIFSFPAPIILALLLNELKSHTFRRIVQSVLYLPYFLSWIILAGIFSNLFSVTSGVFPIFFRNFGIEMPSLITDPKYFIPFLIVEEFGSAHPEIRNPFDAVGFAVSLAAKPGAVPYHGTGAEIWGNTFRADLSDEKLDKLLEIDEWLAGKEGMDLCNWGFKDRDYTVNSDGTYASLINGNIVDLYPSRTLIFYSTWNSDWDDDMGNPTYSADVKKAARDVLTAINVGGVNALKIENQFAGIIVTEETSLFTYDYNSRLMNIITGTGDIRTMYQAMIAEANQQGLQKMIDSVNAVLKK
jgi:hypothetical protein